MLHFKKKLTVRARWHKPPLQVFYISLAFARRKMAEDRDLEIFSDDLFKYLLTERLGIKDYCSWALRTPEDVSNYHPCIGMSVLRHSFNVQYCFFLNFLENRLDVKNLYNFIDYLTNYIEALNMSDEYNIFEKLIMIASVTLELSVFYHLQGSKLLTKFPSKLYFYAFKSFYKSAFFNNGGWNAWKDFISDNLKIYGEIELEASDNDEQTCHGGGWLRKLDQWFLRLALKNYSQEMASASTYSEMHESGDRSDTLPFQEKALHAGDETQFLNERTCKDPRVRDYKIFKDCSRRKKYINKSEQLIQDLKQIISLDKDCAYEQLSELLENDTCVNELMRFCIFPDLIDTLKNSQVTMRNGDILQFVKLILNGKPLMAVYCRYVVQEINELLNNENASKEGYGKELLDVSETKSNAQETNSETDSTEQLTPIKGMISEYDVYKNLMYRFLKELVIGKPYGSTESEICKILYEKGKTLLKMDIFRNIMRITINNPESRWENQWILSIMKLLTEVSQVGENFPTRLSTINSTKNIDFVATEIFNNTTNQKMKIIELPPDNDPFSIITETTQSLLFNRGQESVTIETASDDTSRVEKYKDDAATRENYKLTSASSVTNQNLKDNVGEVIENANLVTLKEDAVSRSSKRSVKDLKTKALPQVVQETSSLSTERNAPDTVRTIKQSMDEVDDSKNKSSPKTSADAGHTRKRRKKKKSKVPPSNSSDAPPKLIANPEEIADPEMVSQVTEACNVILRNIFRMTSISETGCTDPHGRKSTDSFHRHIEKSETCKKSRVSIDKSKKSKVNLERQVTDPEELVSIKPTQSKPKDEIKEECTTVPGKNDISDSDILLSHDNLDSKQRTKLESESNIQPDEIVLPEETPINLDDINLIDFDTIIDPPVLQSNIICSKDITENEKEKPSPDSPSVYENSLSLLPENVSSDASNWILEQIRENDPDLLEMMEAKLIIDNQLQKEVLKHHDTFKETLNEDNPDPKN